MSAAAQRAINIRAICYNIERRHDLVIQNGDMRLLSQRLDAHAGQMLAH